jgi:hypothetical protein
VAEPIDSLVGNPNRLEAVACGRSGEQLFLISQAGVRALAMAARSVCCDGDLFYGLDPQGDLLTLHVPTGRWATTRWPSPIAHLTAAEGRLLIVRADGVAECIS